MQNPTGDDISAVPTADDNETIVYRRQRPGGRSTRADARMFRMILLDVQLWSNKF